MFGLDERTERLMVSFSASISVGRFSARREAGFKGAKRGDTLGQQPASRSIEMAHQVMPNGRHGFDMSFCIEQI